MFQNLGNYLNPYYYFGYHNLEKQETKEEQNTNDLILDIEESSLEEGQQQTSKPMEELIPIDESSTMEMERKISPMDLKLLAARLTDSFSHLNLVINEEDIQKIQAKMTDLDIEWTLSEKELVQFADDIAHIHQHQLTVNADEIVETICMVNEIALQSKKDKKPTWNEVEALNKKIEELKTEYEAIVSKTIFWRCSLKDLNPELDDEPADITLGIIKNEFYLFVSTKNLRPVPFTKIQTLGSIAALGFATMGSYALSGQGIVTKTLAASFGGFTIPVLSEFPYLWRFGVPAALLGGSIYLDTFLDSTYVKTAVLTGAVGVLLYKKFGKLLAKGSNFGPVKGCITPTWPVAQDAITLKDRIACCFATQEEQTEKGTSQSPEETSTDLKNKKIVNLSELELKQLPNLPFQITSSIKLNLDFDAGDFKYALKVNDRKLREFTVGEMEDDDEDDDAEDEKKVKKNTPLWKKAAVLGTSGTATAVSTYFLDQGITTEACNTVFSAAAKIELRHDAFINSYIKLGVPAAALLAIKYAFPSSFVGELFFVPATIAINKLRKELKDRHTGKRPKDMDWYRVPLWLHYYLAKYGCGYQVPLPSKEPIPFHEVLQKGNNQLTIPLDPSRFDSQKPSVEIDLVLKIGGERLTGKYMIDEKKQNELMETLKVKVKEKKKKKKKAKKSEKNGKAEKPLNVEKKKVNESEKGEKSDKSLKKEKKQKNVSKVQLNPALREKLGLSALKPEKAPMWREWAFVGASTGATLAASYLTQQVALASIAENGMRIKAQDLGEGTVTSLLSSIVSTYCKQFGKRFSPEVRELGTLGPMLVALVGEEILMQKDIAPFRFAFLFVKVALGMKAMQAKKFMMSKPYTDQDYITVELFAKLKEKLGGLKKSPKDKDIEQAIVQSVEEVGKKNPEINEGKMEEQTA